MLPTLGRLLLIGLVLAALPACRKMEARVPAATPMPPPALDVPAPPPRTVVPVTLDVPEPPPPPEPGAPATEPAARTTPPTTAKPDPATAGSGAPPSPPPVLQTTPNTAALEQRTRQLIDEARSNLRKVDRRKLGRNAADQFDTAERHIRMAEDAMKVKNYVWAKQLAENAAAVAARLIRGEPEPARPISP